MAQMKTKSKATINDNGTDSNLQTEGPIAEKDEVKKAEDNTHSGQPHDISQSEKLKDEEGRQVSDKENNKRTISR